MIKLLDAAIHPLRSAALAFNPPPHPALASSP